MTLDSRPSGRFLSLCPSGHVHLLRKFTMQFVSEYSEATAAADDTAGSMELLTRNSLTAAGAAVEAVAEALPELATEAAVAMAEAAPEAAAGIAASVAEANPDAAIEIAGEMANVAANN